jgi:hypothetical protein
MSDQIGNQTATERRVGMQLIPCTIRGQDYLKLEIPSHSGRKRRFFPVSEIAKAKKALADATKHQSEVGKAFDVLRPNEKAHILSIIQEIKLAGLTLESVWQSVKLAPVISC